MRFLPKHAHVVVPIDFSPHSRAAAEAALEFVDETQHLTAVHVLPISVYDTPLMSGANAIHGIILLGAIIVTGTTTNTAAVIVGLVAIVLASVNMVGGFVVTDRMLQMFTQKKKPAPKADAGTDSAKGEAA